MGNATEHECIGDVQKKLELLKLGRITMPHMIGMLLEYDPVVVPRIATALPRDVLDAMSEILAMMPKTWDEWKSKEFTETLSGRPLVLSVEERRRSFARVSGYRAEIESRRACNRGGDSGGHPP